MDNLTAKQPFGKISLMLGLANFLFLSFSVVIVRNSKAETILLIWTFVAVVLTLAGIITGAIGLFTKRTWLGLVLNVLFGLFIFWVIVSIFFPPIRY